MPAAELPALDRFATRLRERGIAATLRKLFADHVYRRSESVIVEYCPGWGRPARGAAIAGLSFVTVRTAAEVPPLCDWMAWRASDFRRMAQAGELGVFVLDAGVAVGCVWVSLRDHHDRRTREFYAVGPNEAYHYCWMVDPGNRRRNVALPLCREVCRVLDGMGIERQFGVVDRVNAASYKIQIYFGYREAGVRVVHYEVLGTRWTRMSRYTGTLGLIEPRG